MNFIPLELQACGENNFTMKSLGLLSHRPDLRRRLIKHLFDDDAHGTSTILFFTRIGEGFFREAIEREHEAQDFESRLNEAIGLPSRFRWRRNSNGKLTQPAKWQDHHIREMLAANGLTGESHLSQKLSYLQDCLNTEPDLVLQWGDNIGLVEVKVLSGEGTQQLNRQRMLGELLSSLLGWRCHFALIGPAHGSRPSWAGCRFVSWAEVAQIYADVPEIHDYINEFAFFYRGTWQSMVSIHTTQPASTAFDIFLSASRPSVVGAAGETSASGETVSTGQMPTNLQATSSRDPWHFSHLPRDYFDRVMYTCRSSGHWPIRFVWTGRTGVPYAERANGRAINANWMIETPDRRRRTNGKPLQYDAGKMIRWTWEEVASHFGIPG